MDGYAQKAMDTADASLLQKRRGLPKPADRAAHLKTHDAAVYPQRASFSSDISAVPRKSLMPATSMPDLKAEKSNKRPKFVQRASHYLSSIYGKPAVADEPDYFVDVKPFQDFNATPIDEIVRNILSELATYPGKSLDLRHNGSILRILEAFTDLRVERDGLAERLAKVIEHHDMAVDAHEAERLRSKETEQMYATDVKQLEVMMAKGKTGLSQVALARQQSLIRGKNVRVRAVPHRRREEDNNSVGSMSSPRVSFEEPAPAVQRPNTPSYAEQQLSQSLQANRSFLHLDFKPGTPPDSARVASLADVDIPHHWRKKSEATLSTMTSFPISPSKTDASDFSSTGGDALPDELEQTELNKQTVEHVARMICQTSGASVEGTTQFLQSCIAGEATLGTIEDRTPRPRRNTNSTASIHSDSSVDDMPTIRVNKTVATRRGIDGSLLSIENMPPPHMRRPFSFYAGDDNMSLDVQEPLQTGFNSDLSLVSSQSSPNLLLSRKGSLIPSPVTDHTMAKPRREDSSSSVITSLHRSPMSEDNDKLTLGERSGNMERKSSVPETHKRGMSAPVGPRLMSAAKSVLGRESRTNSMEPLEEGQERREGGKTKKKSKSPTKKGKNVENIATQRI